MRPLPFGLSVAAAFVAGLAASPLLHPLGTAHAQASAAPAAAAALPQAAVYDLAAMRGADLAATSNPDMRSTVLARTEQGAVGLQVGNSPKHLHAHTTELQYIIEGSGQMWLGAERRAIHPGSLIVIPAGTAHAGTIVSDGPVKALFIKLPPQVAGDIVPVE
jgi:quercetin dioxygenase-like cupin family protein